MCELIKDYLDLRLSLLREELLHTHDHVHEDVHDHIQRITDLWEGVCGRLEALESRFFPESPDKDAVEEVLEEVEEVAEAIQEEVREALDEAVPPPVEEVSEEPSVAEEVAQTVETTVEEIEDAIKKAAEDVIPARSSFLTKKIF